MSRSGRDMNPIRDGSQHCWLSNAFACLARRKLLRTLTFRLTFLIFLTINFPLTAMRRDEIISQGDRELIVNMKRETKLERLIYDSSDY